MLNHRGRRFRASALWSSLSVTVAISGVAAAIAVGSAVAGNFTLSVAKHATVHTNGATRRANIVVNGRGFAVYTLSGDSRQHPKCTAANGCFAFWPPVRVATGAKPTKGPGIAGTLRTWRRAKFAQVTLNGHPLYTFSLDKQRHVANGDGLKTFKGTWHVIAAA